MSMPTTSTSGTARTAAASGRASSRTRRPDSSAPTQAPRQPSTPRTATGGAWQTRRMRVFLGSDHAGFELKAHLLQAWPTRGTSRSTAARSSYDAQDDYPPFCFDVGERTVAEPGSLGVVIGGCGNGEQIAANKVPGVRAALAWNDDTARLARQHNDANVVAVGARQHTVEEATALVAALPRHAVQRGPAARAPDRHADRLRARPAPPGRGAAHPRPLTRAQNSSRHQGATGQPNAVEARVTAPGLTSVTRPAACSVASEVPPR